MIRCLDIKLFSTTVPLIQSHLTTDHHIQSSCSFFSSYSFISFNLNASCLLSLTTLPFPAHLCLISITTKPFSFSHFLSPSDFTSIHLSPLFSFHFHVCFLSFSSALFSLSLSNNSPFSAHLFAPRNSFYLLTTFSPPLFTTDIFNLLFFSSLSLLLPGIFHCSLHYIVI